MLTTAQVLAKFAADYSKNIEDETGFLPQVCFDSQWTSPCEIGQGREGESIGWQYIKRSTPYDFKNIEQALEVTLHHDIISFYGTGFSGSMFVRYNDLEIELLQVWNDDDLARLGENIIGHALMQRKLKHSPTVFIGCVANSETMISIDNNSGEVITEIAGNTDRLVIADSLTAFLNLAKPVAKPELEDSYQAPTELKVGLMPRLKEVMKSLLGK